MDLDMQQSTKTLFDARGKHELTRVAALGGLVLVLLFAGCASVPLGTQGERPQDGAVTGPADRTTAPSTTISTGKSVTKAVAPGTKTVPNIPASPAAVSQLAKKDGVALELAKQKALSPLDLTSLEKRLNETRAVDVLTKIAFRIRVDNLLSQFRAFYQGKLKTTLAELRQTYDLLVLELLSPLQDKDPSLAAAIVGSREAIWGILADPARFAAI
jgi:hypothetical protein